MVRIRRLLSVLPPWPVVAAVGGGIAVVVPATFLYARHVHLNGDWYPAAVAASAGWLCAVLAGITVWEYVQIGRGRRPALEGGVEPRSWRQEWRTAVVLVVGILLGWKYFK